MISERLDQSGHSHIGSITDVIMSRWFILMLVSGILFLGSCKQQTDISLEGLYGNWDVAKAVRNGRETPYLRGGYFKLESNGTMVFNIAGSEEKGSFTLEDNILRFDKQKDFVVESIQQDSLALRFVMNPENTFLFYLSRNKDETH